MVNGPDLKLHKYLSLGMSDCCLMPNEQFFSYIMMKNQDLMSIYFLKKKLKDVKNLEERE
jgi:hypothetical protein